MSALLNHKCLLAFCTSSGTCVILYHSTEIFFNVKYTYHVVIIFFLDIHWKGWSLFPYFLVKMNSRIDVEILVHIIINSDMRLLLGLNNAHTRTYRTTCNVVCVRQHYGTLASVKIMGQWREYLQPIFTKRVYYSLFTCPFIHQRGRRQG